MHAGKERAAGNLRRHKLRWQIRESPLLNNERETTISNKQTKRPILMNILYLNICACVCWGGACACMCEKTPPFLYEKE